MKVIGERLEERLEDCIRHNREGHEFRYRLASGFTECGDIVLDAACGTGYGEQFFHGVHYHGVDKVARGFVCNVNLETWTAEDIYYDVAVSFETIEHLKSYNTLLYVLQRARKWIIASVPVVPTVGNNPWHFHDFVPGELAERLLEGTSGWRHYQTVQQPSEESEVVVLRRAES